MKRAIKKIPIGSMVKVEWHDAAVEIKEDLPVGKKPLPAFVCTSRGLLAWIDKDFIAIAQDHYKARNTEEADTYQTIVKIPSIMVRAVYTLKVPEDEIWEKVS